MEEKAILDTLLPPHGQGQVQIIPQVPPTTKPSLSARICSTLKVNPKLLPVKLLNFLVHGGIAALFPYFTLHMISIGISVKEIAVMLLLLPIVSSIGPPLGGALADRLGNYKLVLIIFTILSVILHSCLWFAVPSFGTRDVLVNLTTFEQSSFLVTFPCNPVNLVSVTHSALGSARGQKLKRKCTYQSPWRPAELQACKSNCDKIGFPDPKICFSMLNRDKDSACYHFLDVENFLISDVSPLANSSLWKPNAFSTGLVSGVMQNPHCDAGKKFAANCSVTCQAVSANNVSCGDVVTVAEGDRLTTLALYFTFRFLSFTAVRVVFPLLDAAVLEIAKQHDGDFGIQRLFASVGFCVVPPLSGWLIGLASRKNKFADYSPAFYLFGGMNLLGAMLMICMDIRVRKKQTNIWKSMGIVLRNPNVLTFVFGVFFSGAAFGILVHYLFLFMQRDPGFVYPSPTWLLGLTSTVGYLLGIPLLFFSSQLIRIFGHENLLAFGLLCYAARFISYSFTFNPYLVLPIEIFTAVTGMIIVIAPQFAIKTSPKYLATLVGLFGAVNFGLGGGVGPLVGGFLIAAYGYRLTFQVFSAVCAVVGISYFLIYHLVLKRLKVKALGADETKMAEIIPENVKVAALDGSPSVYPRIYVPRKSSEAEVEPLFHVVAAGETENALPKYPSVVSAPYNASTEHSPRPYHPEENGFTPNQDPSETKPTSRNRRGN